MGKIAIAPSRKTLAHLPFRPMPASIWEARIGATNSPIPPKEHFEWVWSTPEGTLDERLSLWQYSQGYSGTAYSKQNARITETVRDFWKASVIQIDVVDLAYYSHRRRPWSRGDFSDHEDRIWSQALHRGFDTLAHYGGYAIRLWDWFDGLARCWAMPHPDKDSQVGWILFNGFGPWASNLYTIAIALARFNGWSVQTVCLLLNTDSPLRVNGGRGYIVGPELEIAGVTSHTANWTLPCPLGLCAVCNHEVIFESDPHTCTKGVFLCETCLRYYGICEKCLRPSAHIIEHSLPGFSEIKWCPSCLNDARGTSKEKKQNE